MFSNTSEKSELSYEERLLINILRCSINGKQASDDILRSERIDDISLIHMIHRNGILLTVYPGISSNPNLQTMANDLRMDYLAAVAQSVQQDYEGKQILAAFDKARIDACPLKGWTLREIYPQGVRRSMADIDILIREYSYENIKVIMENLGFSSNGTSPWKHDEFTKGDITVEIHKRLTDDSGKIQRWEKGIWSRGTSKGHVYRMSDEDFFVFHMVHMHKDFLNGSLGLRRIADTWLLMNRDLDWEKANKVLENIGILPFVDKMKKLAEDCFDSKEIDSEDAVLIHHACTYGIFGNGDSYKMGRIASMSKRSLREGKFKSLLFAVFLPINRMKAQYPILQEYPILLPFYWLKRILYHVQYLPDYKKKLNYDNITEAEYSYVR